MKIENFFFNEQGDGEDCDVEISSLIGSNECEDDEDDDEDVTDEV